MDRIRALRRERRSWRTGLWLAALAAVATLLVANLCMKSAPRHATEGVSLDALRVAYAKVEPGETAASELTKLGFDTGNGSVKRLSYLGLMEYFAPRDSHGVDQLDPAAAKCLSASNGCSAYVFRLRRSREPQQASFSFVSNAEASDAVGVQVVFLLHDGRVAWKAMSGV